MERDFRDKAEIGTYLRELRERRGLSQADVGAAIGVDQGAVSRIEAGQRGLTARDLMIMAELLVVSTEEILCRDGEPALLRAGDGDAEGVQRSLAEFESCIEDYLGLEAVLR